MFNDMAGAASRMMAAQFPDLCTIRNAQPPTSGPTGGKVKGSTALHSSVPCLYSPLRGSERQTGEGSNAFADYRILMPAEVNGARITVAAKHQIVVAARGNQPARTFEVVNVLNESGVYLACEAVLKN